MLKHKTSWATTMKVVLIIRPPLDGSARPQSRVSLTHNGGLGKMLLDGRPKFAEGSVPVPKAADEGLELNGA